MSLLNKCSSFEKLAGKGIILQRVGGLSPVKQTNKRAPEKYGVWAFIWPYAEMFFLGSTNPEGVVDNRKPKVKSRYDQLKLEGWTKFLHKGRLYTRFPIPGAPEKNGWYLTDADTLSNFIGKVIADATAWWRGRGPGWSGRKPEHLPVGANPFAHSSKDDFEVFVPSPDEGRVETKKRKNNRFSFDIDEEDE